MRLSNSFGFTLFLLLLREKHEVFLLICLFLLITKVFLKFKRILFGKNIRWCTFKSQNQIKFWYFELFSEIFNFVNLAYISLNDYDVTVTSYWDVCSYFGMYGKRRPLAILWYQLHVWGFIYKFTGVVTTPLGKLCSIKGLVDEV